MTATAEWLRDRFRADVDDELPSAADDSAALFSNADVLFYLNEAQREFVVGTRYLYKTITRNVKAEDPTVNLPPDVVDLRGEYGYLETAQRHVKAVSFEELEQGVVRSDYGRTVSTSALKEQPIGTPKVMSLDVEEGQITLFPTPEAADVLRLAVFVEPPELQDFNDNLSIRRTRHAHMLLNGMKAVAYRKLDADVFNEAEANRFDGYFQRDISNVEAELRRKRRKPRPIQYGGC